jgi:hypothetical protein
MRTSRNSEDCNDTEFLVNLVSSLTREPKLAFAGYERQGPTETGRVAISVVKIG